MWNLTGKEDSLGFGPLSWLNLFMRAMIRPKRCAHPRESLTCVRVSFPILAARDLTSRQGREKIFSHK